MLTTTIPPKTLSTTTASLPTTSWTCLPSRAWPPLSSYPTADDSTTDLPWRSLNTVSAKQPTSTPPPGYSVMTVPPSIGSQTTCLPGSIPSTDHGCTSTHTFVARTASKPFPMPFGVRVPNHCS
ncbi:hypothetical protein BCR44DRAFT_1535003 [Catenaria anguillulae PL171]|uniref:Uncharacterized protein n=1 Tax=Catenaria anguillulae PL171 TaxID=765915 RepID=A0A1Y2HJF7_9FUNG|nr:hypothetical protein BCR44DRAFT_1535003 [Catenaria anguillulae PL171]